jgi:hypothetical protein
MTSLSDMGSFNSCINSALNGGFILRDVKVTREIYFDRPEQYNTFCNFLDRQYSFISHTGGLYTDDPRFTSMTDYHMMARDEQQTVVFNALAVAVYCCDDLKFVIDAQEGDHCQFIGITDESEVITIGSRVHEKADERYLAQVRVVIEVCKDIINAPSTKPYENKKYKLAVMEDLESRGILLSKEVVRLIGIEKLKEFLYSVLIFSYDLHTQFLRANIKTGDSITFYSLDMKGLITVHEMVFGSVTQTNYIHHENALKLAYSQAGKRNKLFVFLHEKSCFLIASGFHDFPMEILHEFGKRNSGLSIVTDRYSASDKRQLLGVKHYLEAMGARILVDRIFIDNHLP